MSNSRWDKQVKLFYGYRQVVCLLHRDKKHIDFRLFYFLYSSHRTGGQPVCWYSSSLIDACRFEPNDGFIAVLKHMSASALAAVKPDGIAGQQTAHQCGHRPTPSLKQKVKMVRNQGPGKTLRLGFIDQSCQTANELITILIVKKILRRPIPLAMM
jgi:hypothetical protein